VRDQLRRLTQSVSIVLKLSKAEPLDEFIADSVNPESPEYHRFLTVEQFRSRFAPSARETKRLTDQFGALEIIELIGVRPCRLRHSPVSRYRRQDSFGWVRSFVRACERGRGGGALRGANVPRTRPGRPVLLLISLHRAPHRLDPRSAGQPHAMPRTVTVVRRPSSWRPTAVSAVHSACAEQLAFLHAPAV
jgi:hypothetical protein